MNESGRLAGKRALVTGGSRGIGAAIASRLAADGAEVAVNYVADKSSADALVRELTDKGYQAAAFRADVADRAQIADMVARVVDEFGGLDILASNAGVEHFGALESITEADFDRVFGINVAGQLFATDDRNSWLKPGPGKMVQLAGSALWVWSGRVWCWALGNALTSASVTSVKNSRVDSPSRTSVGMVVAGARSRGTALSPNSRLS